MYDQSWPKVFPRALPCFIPGCYFLLAACFAAAGIRAGPLLVVHSPCSVGYCYAVQSISKAAARRPHRWIQRVERKRLVPSPSRGDAPLRSYSGMNSARRAVA